MPTPRRPYTPRLPPAERRAQLLDAALAVIERDGYDGVSIDAIAREADVTRPVVYHVFDGLTDLLSALLDRQEARAMAQLTAALPTAPPAEQPAAWLDETVRGLLAVVAADPTTWRPILRADDAPPAAVRERIARDREVVRTRVATLLDAWFAVHRRPDGLDTEIVSHGLIAIAEHFGRLALDDPARVDPKRLGATVRALLAR